VPLTTPEEFKACWANLNFTGTCPDQQWRNDNSRQFGKFNGREPGYDWETVIWARPLWFCNENPR
jgi:hypothetical protein